MSKDPNFYFRKGALSGLCLLLCLGNEFAMAAPNTKNSLTKPSSQASAEVGVRLLQEILNRVMSVPQLAMAKSQMRQVMSTAEPQVYGQQLKGGTDYNLAIRPKETAKNWLPPGSALKVFPTAGGRSVSSSLPPTAMGKAISQPGDSQYMSGAAAGGGGGSGDSFESAQNTLANLPAQENWRGADLVRQNAQSAADKVGVWERERDRDGQEGKNEAKRVDAMSPGRVQDLGTSLGRLQGLAKKLEEVQSYADAAPSVVAPQSPSPAAAPAPQLVSAGKNDKQKYKAFNNSPREAQIYDEKANTRDLRSESSSLRTTSNQRAMLNSQSAYISSSSTASEANRSFRRRSNKESKDLLALLPPNVATGIPLVSLGITKTQAEQALQRLGKFSESKVEEWSVLTWRKPGNVTPSLQLYCRHGLLDAMRIFDRSLIAADFGASPGDDLTKVKEKFGEPAFILPEPTPGSGKNYVYPLSHVGFQLSRDKTESSPAVVSVLIFMVK